MADKGQWEAVKGKIFYEIVRVDSTGTIVGFVCDSINKEDADLCIALREVAVLINPSNPMAVAEGLGEMRDWIKQTLKEDKAGNFVELTPELRISGKRILIAITKPTTEKGEVK